MIYTYVNMYIAFVTPVMDVRDRPRPGLKMGVEHRILVRLRFGVPGGTHPPRISRSIYNLNSRVVLLSDLLILFYLYL